MLGFIPRYGNQNGSLRKDIRQHVRLFLETSSMFISYNQCRPSVGDLMDT